MAVKKKTPARKDKASPVEGTGQALYVRARSIIPGGTQLLSKRPERFLPDQWPAYYARAKGAIVWDLDGRRYLDFTHCAVGTCILGFADPDVDAAVIAAVRAGSMGTLNCPSEVELAELLVELHPWSEMVRFARTGGEAMAMAVRIARAATGKSRVAFCGYHGWTDWYLAANIAEKNALNGHLLPGLAPAGVPDVLGRSALPFNYNDVESLRRIVDENGDIAAIAMEPQRNVPPAPGFLEQVRAIADAAGAVLIFDEVTSGWRMNTGGLHLTLGVDPDIAVFAKGISNGYPMAAVVGTRAVMEAVQATFISSTYWTEGIGPAAALVTIRKHRLENVGSRLVEVGNRLRDGWLSLAAAVGLEITVSGIPPLGGFAFCDQGADVLTTLFTQEMLARGFLAAPHVYAMYSHTDAHIESYLDAVGDVFGLIAEANTEGNVRQRLNGPIVHDGFERLN